MVTPILIVLAILVLAVLVYLLCLKGEYEIRQSLVMKGTPDKIFDKIRDLKSWPDWSPWLIHEPETKLDYSENCQEEGGYYSWDGEHIGAGTLTHVTHQRPNVLQEKIEFVRPFKSVCDVSFELKEKDEQRGDDWIEKTEVTWVMQGKMPFLFRFMVPRTISLVSKDYDLGLAMLAGEIDPASPHPRLRFDGQINLEPVQYLSKPFEGYIEEMEEAMQTGFVELLDYVQQKNINTSGKPMSLYHKVNIKKKHFVCDMAVPVSKETKTSDYSIKNFAGGKYYKVTLQGAYRFLELAWDAAYKHVCLYKIKIDKSRPSLEVYENEPHTVTNSNSLITSIYIPVK